MVLDVWLDSAYPLKGRKGSPLFMNEEITKYERLWVY